MGRAIAISTLPFLRHLLPDEAGGLAGPADPTQQTSEEQTEAHRHNRVRPKLNKKYLKIIHIFSTISMNCIETFFLV